MRYEFSLILPEVNDLTDEMANALFEAGCDDATPYLQNRVVRLDFDREASSKDEAVTSAINDVRKAGFNCDIEL